MNFFPSIIDTVGHTPLVRLNYIPAQTGSEILLKCEFLNPLFSVKDRIAKAMIVAAEEKGDLKPGGLIIEPTSGNSGIALAFVSKALGYRCLLVMPDTMSVERRSLLRMLGAELFLTPGALSMQGSINKAREMTNQFRDEAYMPDQFSNPANPRAHYETTGVELVHETDGKIDIFVAGVGTGGTITGIGRRLKEEIPGVQIVAVEPEESAVMSGRRPGAHQIQGIGSGFIPGLMDMSIVDEVLTVSSDASMVMARRVNSEEGIPVGISSGCNVQAAMILAQRPENRGKRIVTVASSAVERYMSTPLVQTMRM